MTTLLIEPALKQNLIVWLQANPIEIYWDRNDGLTETQVKQVIDDNNTDGVENHIWDRNADFLYDEVLATIKRGFDELHINRESIEDEELYDEFSQYVPEDLNTKTLFEQTEAFVRVAMYSNYDCINSHYFERGYTYTESYFGATVDTLNLNPQKVKQALLAADIEVFGKWPNKKKRDGKELITYEEFVNEVITRYNPENLFYFLGKVDLSEYLGREGKPQTVVLPKGTLCGFFSTHHGGGSEFVATTKRETVINVSKPFSKSQYDQFKLEYDHGDNRYTYPINKWTNTDNATTLQPTWNA